MEEKVNPLLLETTQQAFEKAMREMMSKKEWAYFQGKGFTVDLKSMSAEDLSYLVDVIVEEMAVRINKSPESSSGAGNVIIPQEQSI